jgi:protein-S-isoprenylcysteine O-methyltransferase Ste14
VNTVGLLGALGVAVLGFVGYVAVLLVAEWARDEAIEAVFKRPSLAVRRQRYRAFRMTGNICGVLALVASLVCVAAATSGHPEDADDARLLGATAIILALTTVVMWAEWWRRAGRI